MRVGILDHKIGEECIDMEHDCRDDLGHLERQIVTGTLTDIESICQRAGKTQQLRHAFNI